MSIRLVIKVGTQQHDHGLEDGMLVCQLAANEPVSEHMQRVFAIVDVPDSWQTQVTVALAPYGIDNSEDIPDPLAYRARSCHIALGDLATDLGKPELALDWRSPDIVLPQDGSSLNVSLLEDSIGYLFHNIPDYNAVSEGVFTVGVGGDYATWAAADADVTDLTGDMILVQISDVTETASALFTLDIGSHTLIFESAQPSFGDPTSGYLLNINHTSPTAMSITLDAASTGTFECKNLYLKQIGANVSAALLTVSSQSAVDLLVHDLLLDSDGKRTGLSVRDIGAGGGTGKIWNIKSWDSSQTGISVTGTTWASVILESSSQDNGGSIGINVTDIVAATMRNNVSVRSTGSDFNIGINHTTEYNASEDASAAGTGFLINLTPATEFVSLSDTNAEYLRAASGGSIDTGGNTPSLSENTVGERGNARPGGDVLVSMGADEFNVSDLEQSFGGIILPKAIVEGNLSAPQKIDGEVVSVASLVALLSAGFAIPGVTQGVLEVPVVVEASFPTTLTITDPLIDAPAVLPQHFIITIHKEIESPAVLEGALTLQMIVPSLLSAQARLLGELKVTKGPTSTTASRAVTLGHRPSYPLIVYSLDILDEADVTAAKVPIEGSYLVSALFDPLTPSVFASAGAGPGFVGTRRIINPEYNEFRPGEDHEVVWFIEIDANDNHADKGLYRWDGSVWVSYRSMPERALDDTGAFEILDPDGVYEYYARLIGGAYHRWAADNRVLVTLNDPRTCPPEFLEFLANNFGLTFQNSDEEAVRRDRIKNAVPTYKLKGLTASVTIQLRALRFRGTVREIWVNPTAPTNFDDIADASAGIQADAASRGLTELIDPDSGQKGEDLIVVPHGYFTEDPVTYFPSSRVSVHLTDLDGNPLSENLDGEELDEIEDAVMVELRSDILPIHVDIRFFVTDVEIGDLGPDVGDSADVSDALVITEV